MLTYLPPRQSPFLPLSPPTPPPPLRSLFVVAPLTTLATTVFVYAVAPAWLPWVLWVPALGPFVAGRAASALATDDGGSVLSGRLESLTLVRGAGAASLPALTAEQYSA